MTDLAEDRESEREREREMSMSFVCGAPVFVAPVFCCLFLKESGVGNSDSKCE